MNCTVKFPGSFIEERKYIAGVIFRELLSIRCELVQDAQLKGTYEIQFGGKVISMPDTFFGSAEKGYLSAAYIPSDVSYVTNEFTIQDDIPLLFGNNELRISPDTIYCGHDIFASVFFMLTRWEEYVIKDRDYLGRFPVKSALAFKAGFLSRPVVNEWMGMLKNMMRFLDPQIAFSNLQPFRINFTHDIDFLNSPVTIREFAKDLVKRKSLAAFAKRLRYLVTGSNPYDVFDLFMTVSERHQTRSHFYFMTGHNVTGKDGEPYNNTRYYTTVLKQVKERGHIIGFHPSLLSYNDPVIFKSEKQQLEKDINQAVAIGRQHALRFNVPDTWRMWEENEMTEDSTLGFSEMEGFRCGTGCTYSVFDVVSRKALKLKETPLLVMDTTLHVNRKLTLEQSQETIQHYIRIGREYDMPVTFLFHNLINDNIDWKGWKDLYTKVFLQ